MGAMNGGFTNQVNFPPYGGPSFAMGHPPGGPQGNFMNGSRNVSRDNVVNNYDQRRPDRAPSDNHTSATSVNPSSLVSQSEDHSAFVNPNATPLQGEAGTPAGVPKSSHYAIAPNKLNGTYSVIQSDVPMPPLNWLHFDALSVEPGCISYDFLDDEISKFEKTEPDIMDLLGNIIKESHDSEGDANDIDTSHDPNNVKLEGYDQATRGKGKSESYIAPNPEVRKMWLENRDMLKGKKDYGKKAAFKTVNYFNKNPKSCMFKDLEAPDRELKGGDREKEGIFSKLQSQIGAAAHANLHGIRYLKMLNGKISEFINVEHQWQGEGTAHSFEETMEFLDNIRLVLDAMCSRRFGNVSRMLADQFNKLTDERRKLYINVCPALKDACVPPSECELFGNIALNMLKDKKEENKALGFVSTPRGGYNNRGGRGGRGGYNSYNTQNSYGTRASTKRFGHQHSGNDQPQKKQRTDNWRDNVKNDNDKSGSSNNSSFQNKGGKGKRGGGGGQKQ